MTESSRFPFSRKAQRYPFRASAELIRLVSLRSLNGTTEVLSRAGCFVVTTEPLTLGTLVRLIVERHGVSFQTIARVASAKLEGVGLGFVSPEEPQLAILDHWLREAAQNSHRKS